MHRARRSRLWTYFKTRKPSEYSAEKNAQGTLDILDVLKITKPVILVTHLFGSFLASTFYLQCPERVVGVIFTGTSIDGRDDRNPGLLYRPIRAMDMYHQVVQFYVNFGLSRDIAMEAAKWSGKLRENFARHMVYFKMGKKWGEITVPTMVVQDDSDVVALPRAALPLWLLRCRIREWRS